MFLLAKRCIFCSRASRTFHIVKYIKILHIRQLDREGSFLQRDVLPVPGHLEQRQDPSRWQHGAL